MSEFVSGKEHFEKCDVMPIFQVTPKLVYETLKEWHEDSPDLFKSPDYMTPAEIDTLLEKLGIYYSRLCFSGSKLDDWWLILADAGMLIPDTQEASV